jgi:FKBP-type peptidyl-prolyl cis-trans isomerase FkpA
MKNISISVVCLTVVIGAFLWPVSAQDPAEETPAPEKPTVMAPTAEKGTATATADPAVEKPAGVALKTEDEKILYTLGLALAHNLTPFKLNEAELKFVLAGMSDSVLNKKHAVKLEEYGPKIRAFGEARGKVAAEAAKAGAGTFLKSEAAKPGAKTTASGLIYTELKAGTGASPKATDTVTVHYHGTLADGTVFDSSVNRGKPSSFPLNRVIKAWTEGLQLMKVGGKARLVCPSAIAYGDRGSPPKIAPGAALVFEVELISIGGAK